MRVDKWYKCIIELNLYKSSLSLGGGVYLFFKLLLLDMKWNSVE